MFNINPYQIPMPTMTPAPSVQYVNGRQSADNYSMQPNTSVILMDSTMDRFYLKRADASGACTIESYDFHKSAEDPKPDYITRAEFEELKNMVKERTYEQPYESAYRAIATGEPGTNIVG